MRISLALILFASVCFAGKCLINWSGTETIEYPDEPSQINVEKLTNVYIQVFVEGNIRHVPLDEFADFIRNNSEIVSSECLKENKTNEIDCSSIRFTTNYDFNNLVVEPAEDLSNAVVELMEKDIVTFTSYDATNFFANPSKFTVSDYITWYIEDFHGKVHVDFVVEEYGLSQSTKRALEQEISEAIQKILDIHFPPNDD